MDLTALPFNQLVGLGKSEQKEVLLKLSFSPKVGNHLGVVHAGAIYTLAEAASAAFLVKHRGKRTNLGGGLSLSGCLGCRKTISLRERPGADGGSNRGSRVFDPGCWELRRGLWGRAGLSVF